MDDVTIHYQIGNASVKDMACALEDNGRYNCDFSYEFDLGDCNPVKPPSTLRITTELHFQAALVNDIWQDGRTLVYDYADIRSKMCNARAELQNSPATRNSDLALH